MNECYENTITFIEKQFVNIATHFGKVLNDNFFVYVVNATNSGEMKHVYDDIVAKMMQKHKTKQAFLD